MLTNNVPHRNPFTGDADQNSIDTGFFDPSVENVGNISAILSTSVAGSQNFLRATSAAVGTTLASDVIAMDVLIQGVTGQGQPLQGTQSFSQFIGFGDSSTDSGYFFTHPYSNNSTLEAQYMAAVAAGGGLPTSLGGIMNSTLLAKDFGLTAIPVGESGGTNYAASGATVTGALSPGSLAPSIVSQIQTYLASVGNHADPNALYEISGGGNDVKVAATLTGTAAQEAYMVQQANTFAQAIEQLHAAGAQHLLIVYGGPAGLILAGGTADLETIFNQTLHSDLAAADVSFVAANDGQVISMVDAIPAAFGITSTLQPPAGPFTTSNPYSPTNGGADVNPDPSLISNSWALYATQLVSPNAGQADLWADDEHLGAVGQQLEANYNYNLIQNGVPTVGETLSAIASASVAALSSAQFTYQWQSLASGQSTWVNIAGATSSTFVVQQADLGLQLRVQATYTDSTGTSTAISPATSAVVSPPAPTVSSISAVSSTHTSDANTGNVVTVTLTVSEAVTVTGTPTLQLNDNEVAIYASGSGTNTLTFSYTVLGSDTTTNLQVTGLNLPAGAAITDQSGDALSSTVAADLAIQVNVINAIEELYIGYFGRAGDPQGTNFWVGAINSGLTIQAAAASFSVQAESQAQYPILANPSTASPAQIVAFIDSIYGDLFNRAPDSAGLSFWQGYLTQNLGNPQAVGSFILDVINGAQNSSAGQDLTTIINKVAAAVFLTQAFTAAGINFNASASTANQFAHTDIAGITSTAASLSAAEAAVTAFVSSHPTSSLNVVELTGVSNASLAANDGHL